METKPNPTPFRGVSASPSTSTVMLSCIALHTSVPREAEPISFCSHPCAHHSAEGHIWQVKTAGSLVDILNPLPLAASSSEAVHQVGDEM